MSTLPEDSLDIPTYTPDWLDGSFDAKPGGEWMKTEDVRGVLAFIGGYLDAHAVMLTAQGVDRTIVAAVNLLQKKVESL